MFPRRSLKSLAAPHVPFLVVLAVCTTIFAWMISYGTFRLVAEDEFGSFYDHQAASLLRLRWDVPEPSLSGEAFVVEGKVYGYFGPTPALMRLPFALFGAGVGKLTRLYMVVDYVAALVAVYVLLVWAVRRRESTKAQPRKWQTLLLILPVGLGSTLFFLGSRAYVYHEAILCGLAFALWSMVCALRALDAPASRWWVGSLLCGILSVHARAPVGLFALCFLGAVALVFVVRREPPHFLRYFKIGVGCVLGILSFNAVSYLKFGTWEGCPLRLNVQYTPQKLAEIDGKNFHLANLRFNSATYLFQPSFALRSSFPYFYLEFINRKLYPESKITYRDATLALPWSMPALCFLAAVGGLAAGYYRLSLRLPLALVGLAAVPAALAMLTAVAVTQRYTADFLPPLIGFATLGVAGLSHLTRGLRLAALSVAGAFTLLSLGITGAITLHHQRAIVWGVPEEARNEYALWRVRIDGPNRPATRD
ncbi:MAG TPA: hypothetical protein VGE76_12880 [Opitutaceae bacterium]